MEFTGSLQFADESSWLTLTTESDDTVTISVRLNTFVPNQEVMSFEVTPNSGIVRLPAGEILRVLKGNGVGMITGVFAATQGTSSCSYSFSVLPCRKFAYKSLAATIFTTRPEKSPVHVGAEDRLWFYRMAGDVSTYVRFNYLAGGSSSNYELSPTYSINLKYYDLDISADTMLATASAKGLDVSNIVSYDVWIECSGSKSTVYSFVIKRMRLPLKTYRFLGRRGTYEYIHATGKFSRSIESETQVFVNSGIEQELENDYSMTFEQNSGHIDSIGMNGYWLEFLAAKERYIIEKDGSERAIVVDEFKTSLTDRTVSSMTFKWHYANPNNTVIDKVDIDITGLGILGPSTVNDVSNTAQFQVTYSPSNTTQRSITWSVVSGSDYASIDGNGKLTVKSNAKGNVVKVRATSTDKPNIYAEKSVNVTYFSAEVSISFQKDSIEVEAKAGTVTNTFTTTGLTNLRVSASGGMAITTGPSITGYLIGFAYAENTGNSAKMATVTLTGDRTDGKGTFSKSYTVLQKAAASAEDPSWDLPSSYLGEYLTLNPAGGTFDINISDPARAGWRVVFDSPLTLESGSATGTGQGKLSVRYPANDTGSSRSFELILKSGVSYLTKCVAKQAAKAETPKADPSWNLPSTWIIKADGSNAPSIQVTDNDNVGWRLVLPDWIQTEGGMTEGTGTFSLMTAADGNDGSERTAELRLVSTDGNTTYAVCSVSQKAAASQEPSITFSMNSATVKATLTVLTNPMSYQNLTGLNATVSGGLSAAAASIESSSVKVTFAQNTTASERVGTVTVTGTRTDGKGTYSKSFTIVQSAARAATWSLPATQAFEAGGDGAIFTITDKDSAGWRLTLPDWCLVSDGITEGSGDRDTDLVARANDTGSSRTGTVQLVSTDGNTVYATCTVTQESKILPSWNVPTTFRFDSIGQSDLSPSGLDLNITDPDNVGWTIDGPSYVGNSLVSGDPLPISGTGNKSLSLAPDVNTSSERTFDLVLKASTGAVIATCNCTQKASEAENTVAMKIAISNADQKLDVADHNPEVCINTNGLTITDGISLGTIVSMDSQYIYIDIPESNVAELYNKLQVDWKYNQFLYVHILNGSTNPDTVYNNETSEHTDFYNNENFLLCEIAKVQANLFAKVENVVTSHGSIILESDCIIEEYQTRYHVVIKTDEPLGSYVSSQFSSEKFGLVWLMNRDNNTSYLPIFPYVTGVDVGGSVPKLRMDVYRCIPMPLSVFKLNNLAFVTDFAATEATQIGIVSISEIKTGNSSLLKLPTFDLSETHFGTNVPGFDSSVVLEMQNPSVLDLSDRVSTDFQGDIIITLSCNDMFLDIL